MLNQMNDLKKHQLKIYKSRFKYWYRNPNSSDKCFLRLRPRIIRSQVGHRKTFEGENNATNVTILLLFNYSLSDQSMYIINDSIDSYLILIL